MSEVVIGRSCAEFVGGQCFQISGPRNVDRDSARNSGIIRIFEISRNKFANIAGRIVGNFIRQMAIPE
jgi:hypothetical protein